MHEKEERLIQSRRRKRNRFKSVQIEPVKTEDSNIIKLNNRGDSGFVSSVSLFSTESGDIDPDADSTYEISIFEPRFFELLYDYIFHRHKHHEHEMMRKKVYGGRTEVGRMKARQNSLRQAYE